MRLRYVLRERDTRDRSDEQVLSIYRDLGVVPKGGRTDNFNKTPEDVSNYKLVMPGDVVVNKMKAWQGSIAVSAHQGIVSGDYLVCEVVHQVERRYLHHALRSQPMVAEYRVRSKGIRPSQWRLYWDDLAEVELRLPPFAEQRAIADYLDAETARIDALIERRQRMATLVQERLRSKISALTSGEPTVRVRHVTSLRTSGPRGWSERVGSSGQPFVRSGNLRRTSIDLDLSDLAFVEAPTTAEAQRSMIRRGDVLVGITGANTGWVGLPSEVEGGFVSQHVAVLRPSGLEPAWLAYSLFAHQAQDQLLGGQYGGTKQQLGLTDLAELSIFVPPLELQRKAVHQIATEAARAAALLSAITAQVGLLAERRQAMITAAVAGELEVSGMAA